VRERPSGVDDAVVLEAVRAAWDRQVDAVEHLPVGFGAHHWAASVGGRRRLFVTLDGLGSRHSPESLEGAYAGAAALFDAGLGFVVPCLRSCSGTFTVTFGRSADAGALSATGWVDGTVAGTGGLADRGAAEADARILARLHAATPPPCVPTWRPLVGNSFAAELDRRTASAWDSGPYAERARLGLRGRLDAIERWVAAYHRLAVEARQRPWVATHGEPHTRNQLVVAGGVRLVDWESLKLAPRERDLRTLVDSGHADLARPHWPMVEMFDLEWRLDEISQYADWFAAPHTGDTNDDVAIGGLLSELGRPEWSRPGA
jgi:spectinomycin phosphotransferase